MKARKSGILLKICIILILLSSLVVLAELIRIMATNSQRNNFFQRHSYATTDINDKTYLIINTTRIWKEFNFTYGGIFECRFSNETNKDFEDWEVRVIVPEGSRLSSYWNAEIKLKGNLLLIKPNQETNFTIPSKSVTDFGFVMLSNEHAYFTDMYYSGKLIKRVYKDPIIIISLIIMIFSLTILLPLYIARFQFKKELEQLEIQKSRDNKLIEQTMSTFVNFIDAKDEYTRGHSSRVAIYAKLISREMGYDEDFQKDIFYMGLMHDIGKITIPNEILNKTSKLSNEEWKIIQSHTTNGARLLENFTIMPMIKDAVLYHHERYDGKGYMEGLAGENIPLAARIICVADSFDAMHTDRCYRVKIGVDKIVLELERCSGTQFDPDVAKAMIKLLKEGVIK